jgi:YD repeat-containing protein
MVTNITHADGTSKTFQYNDDRRLTEIKNSDGTEQTFKYDNMGRLSEFSNPDKTSWKNDDGTWRLYDAGGKPTKTTKPSDTTMRVDENGRVIESSMSD